MTEGAARWSHRPSPLPARPPRLREFRSANPSAARVSLWDAASSDSAGHLPQRGTETTVSAGLGCCMGIPHLCFCPTPRAPAPGLSRDHRGPQAAPQHQGLGRATSAHCHDPGPARRESQSVQGDDIRPHLRPGDCPLGRGVPTGKLTTLSRRGARTDLGRGPRGSAAPEKTVALQKPWRRLQAPRSARTRGGPLWEPPPPHGVRGSGQTSWPLWAQGRGSGSPKWGEPGWAHAWGPAPWSCPRRGSGGAGAGGVALLQEGASRPGRTPQGPGPGTGQPPLLC